MIKKIQKNMNKKGFTLVELIIVLAVMAILAAIVIPRMSGVTDSFKIRSDERVAASIAREIQVMVQTGVIDDLGASDTSSVVTTDYTSRDNYIAPEIQSTTLAEDALIITLFSDYDINGDGDKDDTDEDKKHIEVKFGDDITSVLKYTGEIN
ncbi:prepilin-type N-terminal cleavage/methylation domain-containing protein [Acidaminobacter sp. JC074]|uniref:prepilin-type N-terminal cleavage/methylation domain-containing protein n=1 Tax=Acidaminobacter sp. JC074 TaxID=2530199 RepID=UPI001F0F7283|nr:prepilin-type N-terminal cleavage/methylation domain-containing protein [Acidaminobacter sp. JC074]MCH4888799.1 prepilin-type N-terminal cleavage/methylation domain-containing protein [Acidaminobacter sp. JC074]